MSSARCAAHGRRGRIDVLCNNAARLGEFHAVLESTPDEWDGCIQVALLGTHHCTKAVLPYMLASNGGSIVNIVSIQAMVGCPTSVAYTTTKAGLLGYTLSAAYDYGPRNVRVNALCPGPIQTRISPRPGTPAYDWQCAQTMLGRVGSRARWRWRRCSSPPTSRPTSPAPSYLSTAAGPRSELSARRQQPCNCSSPTSTAGANDRPLV